MPPKISWRSSKNFWPNHSRNSTLSKTLSPNFVGMPITRSMNRRAFIQRGAACAAVGGLTDLGFLSKLGSVSAAETTLKPRMVQLHREIEPLVRLLETTSRDRVIEEVASRIRRGLTYREVLAAVLLAGVRNIRPHPVGFKFHAVLVINSAHLASLSSPDSDRWLPILWAIDKFKASQAEDEQQGDWQLGPVDESAVPPSHKARAAFIEAMDNWDEAAADVAITGLARTAGAHEIFEILCRYGARDFREIGHKAIYVANSFRTLEAIGWEHAEPVLRSLALALLDRTGDKQNPAKADLPADRPFRRNLAALQEIRPGWLDGKPDADGSRQILQAVRQGSSADVSQRAIELLNGGVAPQSIFDGLCLAAGEGVIRAPGILSLHAVTCTNAMHYAWQHTRDEQTRKLLLLQNCAFLPLFRGNKQDEGTRMDELTPLATKATGPDAVAEIFSELSSKTRVDAARKVLSYLEAGGEPRVFADAARRLIFAKGNDAHDYKFSSAVLEDYHFIPGELGNRYLAASVAYLKGSGASDTKLVTRIREVLKA